MSTQLVMLHSSAALITFFYDCDFFKMVFKEFIIKRVIFFYFQFTQFLAEGSVVKTPSVEKACVSVNLVVMATHTQIV